MSGRAGYLVLSIRYLDGRQWDRRAGLGLCRDTLTMVRALGPLWQQRPPGPPLKVGVTLTHLVAEGSATLPLYDGQARLDGLADAMDKLDARYGRHTFYLGGCGGPGGSADADHVHADPGSGGVQRRASSMAAKAPLVVGQSDAEGGRGRFHRGRGPFA